MSNQLGSNSRGATLFNDSPTKFWQIKAYWSSSLSGTNQGNRILSNSAAMVRAGGENPADLLSGARPWTYVVPVGISSKISRFKLILGPGIKVTRIMAFP